jgi:hypothetical protein
VQIDNGKIVIGVGTGEQGKRLPVVGFVELGFGIEAAQHAFNALTDQFMVVGYKKLHDVSASRACPMWATAVIGSRFTSSLVNRIIAAHPAIICLIGGAAHLPANRLCDHLFVKSPSAPMHRMMSKPGLSRIVYGLLGRRAERSFFEGVHAGFRRLCAPDRSVLKQSLFDCK